MAELDVSIEEILTYFENIGYDSESIQNEIDAVRFNTKNATNRKIKEILIKKFKPKPKTFKAEPSPLIKRPKSLISFFPSNYSFTNSIVYQNFDLRYNQIFEKYFFEDNKVISDKLNSHLEFLKDKFKEFYQVQLSNLTESSDTDIFVVGRVLIDEVNDVEKVYLEDLSGKVCLRLENISEYSIFKGQVLMAKGSSDSLEFIATEIYTKTFQVIENPVIFRKFLRIGVTAGPFSTADLDFSVFKDFLSEIVSEVNILLLIGPFVDSENEQIKSGILNIPSLNIVNGEYEDIVVALNQYINSINQLKKCKIVLIPSIKEMGHIFPLPMPGLDSSYSTTLDCPACPAMISIDNIQIDIVPYDITLEINSTLDYKSSSPFNKIATSLNYLFDSQCYMPVIPNSFPVEYSKFDLFAMKRIPNIFITTSKLALPNDAVFGVFCVKSPGFFEGSKIGCYSVIDVGDQIGIRNYKLN